MRARRAVLVTGVVGLATLVLAITLTHRSRDVACATPMREYGTPVVAALDAHWRHTETSVPHRIALNVPPEAQLDVAKLRADLAPWRATLTLFRDSSAFARSLISADSLRVLHIVYDVRLLTPPEWSRYWSTFWSAFPQHQDSLVAKGPVYRVASELCRGWPCHDASYVEVRSTRKGYVGCRVLLTGTE